MIPAQFMLGGTVWTVLEVTGLGELGHCERDAATIRIRSGLSEQVAASTFLHELFHAILYTMGRTEQDEREVEALAHLMHQYTVTAVAPKPKRARK